MAQTNHIVTIQIVKTADISRKVIAIFVTVGIKESLCQIWVFAQCPHNLGYKGLNSYPWRKFKLLNLSLSGCENGNGFLWKRNEE